METITYTVQGLKNAIKEAKSNLESALTQASWGIKGAQERAEFWKNRLEELQKYLLT